MSQTFEAVIDERGTVIPLGKSHFPRSRRAIVTVLDELPTVAETAILSEQSLAIDWNRQEEDEAWSYLQPDQ